MKLTKVIQNLIICLGLIGILGSDGLFLSSSFQESFEKEVSFDTEEEIEAISSRRAEIRVAQAFFPARKANQTVIHTSEAPIERGYQTSTPLYIKHRSLLI
jgi:hypothetical protein